MKKYDSGKIRYAITFLLLSISVLILLVLNFCIGTVKISATDILAALMGQTIENGRILWDIRLPRALAALILGGGLALSGYLLQTFFHNPIAGPFVLGISSGAKMVVAIILIIAMNFSISIHSGMLIFAAFFGAMISMGFVLLMSLKVSNMSMLVVCGVMVGYICSAATEWVITFASEAQIVNLHNWSRGSFSGMSWSNVRLMTVVTVVVFLAIFFMSKPLSAYQMGEAYAQNMGVNVKVLRMCLVLFSSILSGCIVAFAGPISFVGVAVPHIVKSMLGTTKPMVMIPACFLGGSVFCLLCDLLARTVVAPTELSISTVTAIFGVPVVLWIMINRNSRKAQ